MRTDTPRTDFLLRELMAAYPVLGEAALTAHTSLTTTAHGGIVAASDARLSDARVPLAHTHVAGDITGTAVLTADTRLSDARTPLAHTHVAGDITGTAVLTADARLSDARTPLAHNQAESTITFTDITTGDVAVTQHGYAPRAPNDTTKFLRGDATWAVPTGGSGLTQPQVMTHTAYRA